MSNLIKGIGLAITFGVATAAFSQHTKVFISDRANSLPELQPKYQRLKNEPLECMHLNHKRTVRYDESNNGLLVTITQHLAYHMMYKDTPGEIGLSKMANENAINALKSRALDFYLTLGLDYSGLLSNIRREMTNWKEYFSKIYAEQ